MKRTCGLVFTLGLTVCAAQGFAAQNSQANSGQRSDTGRQGRTHPVAVEVISVDPQANTITVREITAIAGSSGSTAQRTLSVPATATGKQVSQMHAGERVDITCDVEPTTASSGKPAMLADCLRVTQIMPSTGTTGTTGTGSGRPSGSSGSSTTSPGTTSNPNSGSSNPSGSPNSTTNK